MLIPNDSLNSSSYNMGVLHENKLCPVINIPSGTSKLSITNTILMSFVLATTSISTINPMTNSLPNIVVQGSMIHGIGTFKHKVVDVKEEDNNFTKTVLGEEIHPYNRVRKLQNSNCSKEYIGVKKMKSMHLNNETKNKIEYAGILDKKAKDDYIEINERLNRQEDSYTKVMAPLKLGGVLPKKKRIGG